jgi:DNA-binding MarR family transcriptional regulator
MAAITSVMRTQQIFLAEVNALLQPLGLTFARYEVLMLLSFSRRRALPMSKLGERLQVHPASVTNAVGRLERDGLVTRRPNPDDGRGTLARITSKGEVVAREATEQLNGLVFSAVELGEDELARLFELLAALRRAAGDFG